MFQVELLLDMIHNSYIYHPLQKVELNATNSTFTAAVVFAI